MLESINRGLGHGYRRFVPVDYNGERKLALLFFSLEEGNHCAPSSWVLLIARNGRAFDSRAPHVQAAIDVRRAQVERMRNSPPTLPDGVRLDLGSTSPWQHPNFIERATTVPNRPIYILHAQGASVEVPSFHG